MDDMDDIDHGSSIDRSSRSKDFSIDIILVERTSTILRYFSFSLYTNRFNLRSSLCMSSY